MAAEGEQKKKRVQFEEVEEERVTKKPKEAQQQKYTVSGPEQTGGTVRKDESTSAPEGKRRRESTRIEDIMISQLRKWRKS